MFQQKRLNLFFFATNSKLLQLDASITLQRPSSASVSSVLFCDLESDRNLEICQMFGISAGDAGSAPLR